MCSVVVIKTYNSYAIMNTVRVTVFYCFRGMELIDKNI